MAFRASRMRCSVLWMVSPSGTVVSSCPRRATSSSPIAVGVLRRPSTGSSGRPSPAQRPSNQSALSGAYGNGRLKLLFEVVGISLGLLVDPRLVDHAGIDQPLAVDRADRRMGLDRRVHQRLGEARLVALVVTEAAVAPHVDDDVAVEQLAELDRQLASESDRLRIVAVDVEDRRLDALGDIRRVRRGARKLRAGGKADLVVDDEMDRAAGRVAGQARKAQAFPHHALAGEGGVAVEQHRQHRVAFAVALERLRARGPCRARPGRPPRDATGWAGATNAPCCRRTRGPTRCRGGI